MINRRIGTFIATLRKEQNLTQEQFAEKLGVSNRSVSRWENGSTLPDFSLMQSICQITGVTLPELFSGRRDDPSGKGKNHVLSILALWDREKLAKIKTLNLWFALGFVSLLTAILAKSILTQPQTWVLVSLGVFFHSLGFYHNTRDFGLTDAEKAILAASGDPVTMRHPEELLTFSRKAQNVAASQYKSAFRVICENLTEDEHASFAMVGKEYSIGSAPGIWHCGIAVTQNRVFLCGETIAGRFMTRTVTDIYDKKEILCVQYTDRSILMKTTRGTVTIKGENFSSLGEVFKDAVGPRK